MILSNSILVVDDEQETVELVRLILKAEGFRVYSTNNGKEAIRFLDKNPEKPNLVLLDIQIPKVNGLDVCRWIKSHPQLKSIPVFMFTVLASKEDRISGEEAGADVYLTKPFSPDVLLSLIELYLDKSEMIQRRNRMGL